MTDPSTRAIVIELYRDGEQAQSIAASIGISRSTITRIARQAGLESCPAERRKGH